MNLNSLFTIWFRCPHCDAERCAVVDIGEHEIDMDTWCHECGHEFTEAEAHAIRQKVEADAIGMATDAATDRDR